MVVTLETRISIHQKPDKYMHVRTYHIYIILKAFSKLTITFHNNPQIIVVNFCQNCGFIEISISSRISMSPGLQTY